MVEYQAAGWKSPFWYSFWTVGVVALIIVWASLSWVTVGVGAIGLGVAEFFTGGAALAPLIAAVKTCVNGASSMYVSFLPRGMHWWGEKAKQWQPVAAGKYYWPQVERWNPKKEWRELEVASGIMFSVGILIVLSFLFVMIRTHFRPEGKDPLLGVSLIVPPVAAFFGITQYYFNAQHAPPAQRFADAEGYFDWAFDAAVVLSFLNMLPILFEMVVSPGSFRLWEVPRQIRGRKLEQATEMATELV